jgi:putative ABC transport system substrate-binding protein
MAWLQPAHGQSDRVRFIASLAPGPTAGVREKALVEGLRELGWVEGKNIKIDFRFGNNDVARLRELAKELAASKVEIIVAWGTPAIAAAKAATTTIPIVMGSSADPLASGFVPTLARPGGNITGMSFMMPGLAGKRLELLKEVLPGASKIAYLLYADDPAHKLFLSEAEQAGVRAGVQIHPLILKKVEEIPAAFEAIRREKADALMVQPLFAQLGQVQLIGKLALTNRVPTISDAQGLLESGGLIYFGPDLMAAYRRGATHVDRILRGAKPGELPVEQPQRFETAVNLAAAKRLGIELPPALLARADRVVR